MILEDLNLVALVQTVPLDSPGCTVPVAVVLCS